MTKHISTQQSTFRLLPRHGEPTSIFEWITQRSIRCLAFPPIYAIFIGFLTAVAWIWIVPLVGGHG